MQTAVDINFFIYYDVFNHLLYLNWNFSRLPYQRLEPFYVVKHSMLNLQSLMPDDHIQYHLATKMHLLLLFNAHKQNIFKHYTSMVQVIHLISNGVLLKMEVGIRKRASQRAWRYPAYLWSLRWVYAVKKNPEVGIRRIPAYTPQYTTANIIYASNLINVKYQTV